MKKQLLTLLCSSVLFSPLSMAHSLKLDQMLPQTSVSEAGEITLKGQDAAYQQWHSSALSGKALYITLPAEVPPKKKTKLLSMPLKRRTLINNNTKLRLLLTQMMLSSEQVCL